MTVRPIYLLSLVVAATFAFAVFHAGQIKSFYIYYQVHAELAPALAQKHLAWGSPVYIRIFKEEKQLEVWMAHNGHYELFDSYPVCVYSGHLGPKISEGDRQAPEGFYTVTKKQMVPGSAFHLSFDLGFPNEYDRTNGRTGTHLMVHGGCISAGCYAITDKEIDKVFSLMEAAFENGQAAIPVHIFPFRLAKDNLAKHNNSRWVQWWTELEPAYDSFEKTEIVPLIMVKDGKYFVSNSSADQ